MLTSQSRITIPIRRTRRTPSSNLIRKVISADQSQICHEKVCTAIPARCSRSTQFIVIKLKLCPRQDMKNFRLRGIELERNKKRLPFSNQSHKLIIIPRIFHNLLLILRLRMVIKLMSMKKLNLIYQEKIP